MGQNKIAHEIVRSTIINKEQGHKRLRRQRNKSIQHMHTTYAKHGGF